MAGMRWQLFRLFGIPINVDASWLIIFGLLAWTLSDEFHKAAPEQSWLTAGALGVAAALTFFACIVLHELGHALVARKVGIPIRGVTLFLFGGVAEMVDEPPSARSEFLMAVAGPAVSAVLAALFFLLSRVTAPSVVAFPLLYLALINLAVLLFNLVPAFPLDGGRVLRSILWASSKNLRRATYIASQVGVAFAWFLIITGLINLVAMNFAGVWLVLIGFFLKDAAKSSYQQVLLRQALHGEPVSRFMTRQPIVVPASLDLESWVEDYVLRYHRREFPVASNGHLEGLIATQDLEQFPRKDWSQHQVAEVMNQDVKALSTTADADALDALGTMQRTGSSRLLVTEGDRLVGIVSLKDLLQFLDLKIELDDRSRS